MPNAFDRHGILVTETGTRHVRQARLFAFGVLAQAGFGFAALIVVRWGFQSWPQGSYTWIPGLITIAGLSLLVWLGRFLGARGLPFAVIVAAWYLGRIAAVFVSKVLPGVGFDASLLETASFGALVLDGGGRLGFGSPSLEAAVLPVAVLAAAYAWGRRGRASSDESHRSEVGGRAAD